MTYTWIARPSGFPLAPALQILCAEIAASPRYQVLTNLGEIGDVTHQGQGVDSDHNPFIIGPSGSTYPGQGYVRAIDLGGDYNLLMELRGKLHALYVAQDARVYPYGYFKGPDSNINDWFGSGWHVNGGDEGHLHISLNQADGYNPSSGGYVRAIDSTAPWNIDGVAAGIPQDPLEEIMSWYSDKASFEARFIEMAKKGSYDGVASLMDTAAFASAVQDGAWGKGKSPTWWLFRLGLWLQTRKGNAAFGTSLLEVTSGGKVDTAATAKAEQTYAAAFNGQEPLAPSVADTVATVAELKKTVQALQDTVNNDLTEAVKAVTSGPKRVVYTRPASKARVFLPVNDGAERRWVSGTEVRSWPEGYTVVALADTDPFWQTPSLTANAEADADKVEAAAASQNSKG